jgi:hypothetical protein
MAAAAGAGGRQQGPRPPLCRAAANAPPRPRLFATSPCCVALCSRFRPIAPSRLAASRLAPQRPCRARPRGRRPLCSKKLIETNLPLPSPRDPQSPLPAPRRAAPRRPGAWTAPLDCDPRRGPCTRIRAPKVIRAGFTLPSRAAADPGSRAQSAGGRARCRRDDAHRAARALPAPRRSTAASAAPSPVSPFSPLALQMPAPGDRAPMGERALA